MVEECSGLCSDVPWQPSSNAPPISTVVTYTAASPSIKAIKDQSESDAATLLARLQWRAYHQPERVAYQFLADEVLPVALSTLTTWTYQDLFEQTQIIARAIRNSTRRNGTSENGTRRSQNSIISQPVLLVYPPGLELIAAFLGCLSAGAIATLVPPPASS